MTYSRRPAGSELCPARDGKMARWRLQQRAGAPTRPAATQIVDQSPLRRPRPRGSPLPTCSVCRRSREAKAGKTTAEKRRMLEGMAAPQQLRGANNVEQVGGVARPFSLARWRRTRSIRQGLTQSSRATGAH